MRVNEEDKLRRSVINRILCHTVLVKSEIERDFRIDFEEHFALELARLRELERDGLVRLDNGRIEVLPLGRILIRNVAMVFDAYLRKPEAVQKPVFSKTL
jgi:oxygen-independent coproporphyrinogen-3 oxidase